MMISTPEISVVMATYNGERFISEAIDSILNQTYTNFEFIIVNDGSTDNTEQIIQSYKDKRIIYIKKDVNTGIADSLNIGIEAATGTYIARMDDDDVSMLHRFEKQLEVFKKKNIILCASNVLLDRVNKINQTPENHNELFIKLLFGNAIVHPTVMIKRKNVITENYKSCMVPSEDYDLWSRLIFKGDFYKIGEPLLRYRYHITSETARRRKEQLYKNISITQEMYLKLGLISTSNHNNFLSAFTSHNYSISALSLRKLILWFKTLKSTNEKLKLFDQVVFNAEANKNLRQFVISYFTNNRIFKKILAFILIDFKHKQLILKYYSSKLM